MMYMEGFMLESKVIPFEKKNYVDKSELAKKMIDIHTQINTVKIEAECERRRMEKTFDRRIKEVVAISLGNKKDIEKLYKRTDDHIEDIERLQGYVHMGFKFILGILATIIFTALIEITFGVFQ